MAPKTKPEFQATYLSFNPAQLKRDLVRCQDRLLNLSRTKQAIG